jgi:RNA polymerase sigma-70 factor (ECF subfamily)
MFVHVDEWSKPLEREMAIEPEVQFAALVQRQSRFVFRVAYTVLRNAEDAEEAVQDTFFKLFRSGAWKDIRDERAFLASAVWRIAVDRRQSRKQQTIEPIEIQSLAPSPERTIMEAERERVIHQLIDSLPDKLRRPLLLFSTVEMTTVEIAALLDLPEGTVRRQVNEARTLLKEKLARWEARKHA